MMLSVGTPFVAIQSLIPVLANGLDVWLGSILPVLAFAMGLMIIVVLGLHKRRYWFINYVFYSSSALLAAYPAGFCSASPSCSGFCRCGTRVSLMAASLPSLCG